MAREPISKTLRAKIRKDIATPGYSDDDSSVSVSSIQSGVSKAISDMEEVTDTYYGSSTENRAGWLASITDAFGFGDDEEVATPSSTYDEAASTFYSGIREGSLPRDLASGDNFDYNAVANVSAMADNSFTSAAEQVAANLNIPVNWMYAVMDTESGFDPQIRNQEYVQQGREADAAIGIIQFMPATAEALGTSVEELQNMSRTEQLTYVERFFEQYADRIQSPEDLYVATFYPRALGEDDDFVLGSERSSDVVSNIVEGNRAIDSNNDGQITLGEVKQFYRNSRGFNNFIAPFTNS